MEIGGISIVAVFGVVNLLLVSFQLLTGLGLLKVSFNVHKKSGIILMITALIHGTLAYIQNM